MNKLENKFNWSVFFDKWKEVDSKYWVELNDDLSIYKWDISKNILVKNDDLSKKWIYFLVVSVEFFVKYVNSLLLEDNIVFLNELINYYGRVFEFVFLINKE